MNIKETCLVVVLSIVAVAFGASIYRDMRDAQFLGQVRTGLVETVRNVRSFGAKIANVESAKLQEIGILPTALVHEYAQNAWQVRNAQGKIRLSTQASAWTETKTQETMQVIVFRATLSGVPQRLCARLMHDQWREGQWDYLGSSATKIDFAKATDPMTVLSKICQARDYDETLVFELLLWDESVAWQEQETSGQDEETTEDEEDGGGGTGQVVSEDAHWNYDAFSPIVSPGISQSGTETSTTLTGSLGSDSLTGSSGNDVLYSGAGNDRLYGADGDDVLYGRSGNDVLYGGNSAISGTGQKTVYGGSGNDTLWGGLGSNTIYAGSGNDAINTSASQYANTIYAGSGADHIIDGAGSSWLYVGSGDDIVHAGAGDDYLFGEDGDDLLDAGSGSNTINGGNGNDVIFSCLQGESCTDTIDGGAGLDIVVTGMSSSAKSMVNSEQVRNVEIWLQASDAEVLSTQDSSASSVLAALEILCTETTVQLGSQWQQEDDGTWLYEYVDANKQTQQIRLTPLSETIVLSQDLSPVDQTSVAMCQRFLNGTCLESLESFNGQSTILIGTQDGDSLRGNEQDNILFGANGNDSLQGEAGNDILLGGAGDDELRGGSGDDYVCGGLKQDRLFGEEGNDILFADADDSLVSGGDGLDICLSYDSCATAQEDIELTVTASCTECLEPLVSHALLEQLLGIRIEGETLSLDEHWQEQADGSWGYGDYQIQTSIEVERFTGNTQESAWLNQGSEGMDYLYSGESYTQTAFEKAVILALAGDDTLYSANTWHVIQGGEGNDEIYASLLAWGLIQGGTGDDLIQGSDQDEMISAGAGNDLVYTGLGNDFILAGAGDDVIYGGPEEITETNADADFIDGGLGADTLFAGAGDDIVVYDPLDSIDCGEGSDWLLFATASDLKQTTACENALSYTEKKQDATLLEDIASLADLGDLGISCRTLPRLNNQGGQSTIVGTEYCFLSSDWRRVGREDGYTVYTNASLNLTLTTKTNFRTRKWFVGDGQDESIDCQTADACVVQAGGGNDIVYGSSGSDTIYADGGDDIVYAGKGSDVIWTGDGNDYIDAGANNDTIYIGSGNSIVLAGAGTDTLYGIYGSGSKVFIDGGDGKDIVYLQGGQSGEATLVVWDELDTVYLDEKGYYVALGVRAEECTTNYSLFLDTYDDSQQPTVLSLINSVDDFYTKIGLTWDATQKNCVQFGADWQCSGQTCINSKLNLIATQH